nr:ribonuclease H-like domain-containing protein [Tanacetum cinerariifolium]
MDVHNNNASESSQPSWGKMCTSRTMLTLMLPCQLPRQDLKDKRVIDSGCSRYMTGNKSYLTYYEEIDGEFVAFGGDSKRGKSTGKGKTRTSKLDFKDVYFVKELKFNLFSVSQMCDKKNSVLFTDTACVVLSPDFKLTDESNVLLKVPKKDNMYNVDLKNVVPQRDLSKITKSFNKLIKDLFQSGSTYYLVVTDDFSRFSWVFFLATKDETSEILKTFITSIENLIDLRVKVIRCDNGTEFKNRVMNQFYEIKGIKREFSVARTPQQNRVAKKKNRTLIEAAKTMLSNSKLPITLWAKAVNTACYVQNRVLVIKPHNKTPYEHFLGSKPALSFMRPFGCPVTILNTIDQLGKFDGKADEGFFIGYSANNKAFRVFNSRTRTVKENLHVKFSENTPNIGINLMVVQRRRKRKMLKIHVMKIVRGGGKKDAKDSKNKDSEVPSTKEPKVAQEKDANVKSTNNTVSLTDNAAGIKDNVIDENIVYGRANDLNMSDLEEIGRFSNVENANSGGGGKKDAKDSKNKDSEVPSTKEPRVAQEKDANVKSTNNTVSLTDNAAGIKDNVIDENIVYGRANDLNMSNLEEIGRFSNVENADSGLT